MTAHMSDACPPLSEEDLEHVLARTRSCWDEARGQACFLTGGTGFFGMWLLESFAHANDRLALGASVTVLTRRPAAFARKAPHLAARPDVRLVAGDVRDFPFPPGEFPFVIHAATSTSLANDDAARLAMLDEIISGTGRVLEFAAQAGARKLLLTSSGAVYGPQPDGVTHLPEEQPGASAPLPPEAAYGVGKRQAEQLCATQSRATGCAAKIARCFAFVGPHLPLEGRYAIGNFLRDALRGEPIRVAGDGTPRRSYLYSADLAAWLWTILFRGQPGRAYNVGSMHDVSVAELAATVSATLESRQPVSIAQTPVPGQTPSRYVPDTRRAQAELGLQENFSLAEAIRRTARWHCTSPTPVVSA